MPSMEGAARAPILGSQAEPLGEEVAPQTAWKLMGQVLIYTTLWWISAVVATMQIKATTAAAGIYPHAFAFTSLVQPLVALLAFGLSKVVYRRKPAVPRLLLREWMMILGIGAIQGAELGLTNKALQYLTVASRTMLNSTSVLAMMAVARLWGLEALGWRRMLSGSLMILGGFLQGQDEASSSGGGQALELLWLGAGLQVASMLLSAQRWAMTQMVMSHTSPESSLGQIAKLQLMSKCLPITGVVCVMLALGFEPGAYEANQLVQGELPIRILTVALSVMALVYSELKLVKLLSAVAVSVLATVHQIPIALAGVLLQHDHVGPKAALGFALCIVAALVYAWARDAEREEKQTRGASVAIEGEVC